MALERVNPPSLARPSGFSHAVVTTGGTLVFLAGQTALGPDGAIVGDTVAGQFERALANLLVALRAAGGSAEHLASLTIYAVDLEDYRAHGREIGAAWRRLPFLDPGLPAELLPAGWNGLRADVAFGALQDRLAGPARAHVLTVTGG